MAKHVATVIANYYRYYELEYDDEEAPDGWDYGLMWVKIDECNEKETPSEFLAKLEEDEITVLDINDVKE